MNIPWTDIGVQQDYLFDPYMLPLTHTEIAHRYGFEDHRCMGHNGFTREGFSTRCTEFIHSDLVALAIEWLQRIENARPEYRISPAMQNRLIAPADILLCPFHRPQFLENAGRFWEIYKLHGGLPAIPALDPEAFHSQIRSEAVEESIQSTEDNGVLPNSIPRSLYCPGPNHEGRRQHVSRRPIPEICPICHCPLLSQDEGLEKLVWCKDGCGNNMHAECFNMWAESCRARACDFSDEESDEDIDEDPYDYRYDEEYNTSGEDLSGNPAMHQVAGDGLDEEAELANVTCVVCRCQWAMCCPCDTEVQPKCEEAAVEEEHEQIIKYADPGRKKNGLWSNLALNALEWIFHDDFRLFGLRLLPRRLRSIFR